MCLHALIFKKVFVPVCAQFICVEVCTSHRRICLQRKNIFALYHLSLSKVHISFHSNISISHLFTLCPARKVHRAFSRRSCSCAKAASLSLEGPLVQDPSSRGLEILKDMLVIPRYGRSLKMEDAKIHQKFSFL